MKHLTPEVYCISATVTSLITVSHTAASKKYVTKDFSTNVNRHSVTTLANFSQDIDLLKNNIVIVFIGVFAISFLIFVLMYTYFKCYRKIVQASEINGIERQTHYKLARFEEMELERTAYRELDEPLDSEPEYLTPVFSETQSLSRNNIQLETM